MISLEIKRIAGMGAILGLCTLSAQAGTVTIGPNDSLYRYGGGGEFSLTASGGQLAGVSLAALGYTSDTSDVNGTSPSFQTFCIERTDNLSFGATYDYDLNIGAVRGGHGGFVADPNSPGYTIDYISVGTAYLYQAFATGALAAQGYNYSPSNGGSSAFGDKDGTAGGWGNGEDSRAESAYYLQHAIWWLEDEIRSGADYNSDPGLQGFDYILADPLNNPFLAHLSSINVDLSDAGWGADNDLSNPLSPQVGALNLNPDPLHTKQDQLVLWDSGFKVPDGGLTVILMGLSLGGIGLLKRFT
jgi:hypothetical protein